MLNLRRIEASDRRLAALHEAGHAVLAREMGMLNISAEIWRAREPSPDRKSWAGQVQFLDILAKIDPSRRRMIGVAGLVAVDLFLARTPAAHFSGFETLSPTDLAMAGVIPDAAGSIGTADTRDLTRACVAVAGVFSYPEIRSQILKTARRLILDATGRYDGPLFETAFVVPHRFVQELSLMAAEW